MPDHRVFRLVLENSLQDRESLSVSNLAQAVRQLVSQERTLAIET